MDLLKPQPTTRPRRDSVSSDTSFHSAISFQSDTSYHSVTPLGAAEAPEVATSTDNTGTTSHSRRDSTTSLSSTDSGVSMSSGTPFHSNNTAGPSNPNPSSSIPSGGSTSSVHPHHTESTDSNPCIDSASPGISTTSSTIDDESANRPSRKVGAHSD
ncbi:hypothetical protein THARTR1_03755 [Trichoderma harzianum]|uniref:Uncharacterized protein n=1 Tax=Trichoderma harzianum TaxID=5544 RepID=A0A2K0UEL0_TRIHA|nr:hypothetical protein THARTR1_03755 [Trichoderma harzianum]